jgi:hypothetical protein
MAARKGSSGGGGDSKQGLIITMVIFILLSILLGVTTYLGFSGQSQLAESEKKKEADRKSYEDGGDWYKFQALLYRSYLGQPLSEKEAGSLVLLRDKFDSNGLKPRDKDEQDSVGKIIRDNLDKTYGWDKDNKKPASTAEGQIAAMKLKLEEQGKNFANEQAKTAKLSKDLADKDQALKKANEDHANALKALTEDWEKKYQAKAKELEDLQTLNKQLGEERAKVLLENDTDKKKNAAALANKDKEIKTLKDDLLRKEEEANNQRLATSLAEAKFVRLENDRPRGEVSLITGTGQTPFINLGTADKVRTGLRFTVHGIDNNGKPKLEAKATLEIIDIVKDHLSQARLIKVVDPGNDPVLVGDKLFNPAWDPNRKKHVAIAGVVDLSGAHKDGLAEFIRELKRQDIEVDAYIDLKEATTKGEITRNTDFLILGEQPEESSLHLSKDKMAQIAKETDALTKAAARNAVPLISLREFMAVTGYPAAPSGDTTNYNIHPKLSTGASTSDRFNKK